MGFYFHETFRIGKSTETEGRLVVVKGYGDKEGNGQDRLMSIEFPLEMVKMFWNQVDLMVAMLYVY